MQTKPTGTRLVSLDQFRGYTVAGMFVVNFLGGFAAIAPFWKHHNNYCSYADTIMPQFLFAVGFAFQWTFVKRKQKDGASAAYLRVVRRLLGLALVAIIVYEVGDGLPSWKAATSGGAASLLQTALKRTWFQTLMHIAVTSLWAVPVVGTSAGVRIAYMLFSAALHLFLSYRFYFAWVNTDPVGIDGGPLGFLTWSIPLLVGTLAADGVLNAQGKFPLGKMAAWSVFLMGLGYLISCPTTLYDLPAEAAAKPGYSKISSTPLISPAGSWSGREWKSLLAEPPFVAPPPGELSNDPNAPRPEKVRQWNYWMMSQRGGTLSYLTFSAGFSLAVFALFVVLCDILPLKLSLFTTLGTNALAAYIFHGLVDSAVSPFAPGDSPLWYTMSAFGVFFLVTYLLVRHLEKNGIYIRM